MSHSSVTFRRTLKDHTISTLFVKVICIIRLATSLCEYTSEEWTQFEFYLANHLRP
jgi:hypothetical protein